MHKWKTVDEPIRKIIKVYSKYNFKGGKHGCKSVMILCESPLRTLVASVMGSI